MENLLKASFLISSLFFSTAFADSLILSARLKIEYPAAPLLISHGSSDLIIKYKDWSFMHEVFDPETFYEQIDLTGLEVEFVRSIYDDKKRSKLPEWLAVVSRQLADGLGNDPDTVKQFKVGKLEILTGHDNKNHGQIFIIDESTIHKIIITGSKKELDLIAKNIKER